MGKIEKTFWWLCFILAIYTTIGFKLIPNVLKDQLIKNLDENLLYKSSIEKVEFNPYTLKAVIHGYKLKEEMPIIQAKNLSLDFGLIRSITDSHINIQEIKLSNFFANVIEDEKGEINLTKLLKPSQESDTPKQEEESKSDIKFLVSKLIIENSKIDFTKLKENETPYNLSLNNINYELRDFGTYNNSLSSNDLKLKLNEFTTLAISGAFRLEPFKMYGKVDLKDLRAKELLSYDMSSFNFDINKETNLNLLLNYNINLEKDTDIKLSSEILNLNNLSLIQNNSTIAKLDKISIAKFDFDLLNQLISINNPTITNLNIAMTNDKDGINFANLVKSSTKEEEPVQDTKPWIIKLSNSKLDNTNFTFDDKINAMNIKVKNFNTNVSQLNINGSDISILELNSLYPEILYVDNKSSLNLNLNDTNTSFDKLNLTGNKIDISNILLKNKNINLKEKSSKLFLNLSNNQIKNNNFNMVDSNITLDNPNIKFEKINLSQDNLKIDTKNTNIDLNSLKVINSNLAVNSIKLNTSNLTFNDKTNLITSNKLNIIVDKFSQEKDTTKLSSINLTEPKIEYINNENKTKVVANNINLNLINFLNNNNSLKIEKTVINKPIISVTLPKNSSEVKNTVETKNEKTSQTSSSNKKINVGPINIKNATLNFEDKSLPIPFKTTVSKLNGNVSEFKNSKSSTSKLEVKGVVDEYGTTKITGIVNPNSMKVLTDINMIFRNIAMSNFTPYSGKFIGRELKSGKLDLDLKYNILKSDLDAKNNIIITKLELGETVESKDAVSLPLELAIALLEDRSGVIDLNLPISGNVDDPQFSVAPIVWKAFVNLITKAITAPFSLLGAIFGFDENEIKSVNFDFAQSEITPIQQETLDKISQILTKRPNIIIEIQPTYYESKDLYMLRKEKFDAIVDKKIPNRDNKDYENDYIDLLENMYVKYDKKVKALKEQFIKNNKLETKPYIKSLEDFIVSKQEVTKLQLEELAKKRVVNMKTYLVKEKAIKTAQIKINKDIKVKQNSDNRANIDLKITN